MTRALLLQLIGRIAPHDLLEAEQLAIAQDWVRSDAGLYRTAKPSTPPRHLVSYFLPIDPSASAALLVDHKAASLWLPPGGHVEPEEHPAEAVRRELREELGWEAEFLLPEPLFLTINAVSDNAVSDATDGHTDVSLWYALRASRNAPLTLNASEHREAQWFALSDLPYGRSDPHLRRFIEKLSGRLDDQRPS